MTPPKDAFEKKDLDEATEERKWNAFWHTFPGWLRSGLTTLLGAAATWLLMQVNGASSKPSELHRIAVEVGRMNAGFKAFVETQPLKTKVQVYEAMNVYDDKQKAGN